MINSIVANISADTTVDIFNDKEVNVAIKSIWIYNNNDNVSKLLLSFTQPVDTPILNLEIQPKETIFIDSDLYVPIQNYLSAYSDNGLTVVFSFIEDSRTNTIS